MRGTWGEMWRKGRQLAAATAAVALTGVGLTSGAARAADGPTLPTQSYAIITAPAQIAVPASGTAIAPEVSYSFADDGVDGLPCRRTPRW